MISEWLENLILFTIGIILGWFINTYLVKPEKKEKEKVIDPFNETTPEKEVSIVNEEKDGIKLHN